MILLLTTLCAAGLIAYYFLILKPQQDAKISKKTKSQGEVVAPVEPVDSYAEIINDWPTYDRQVK